MRTPAARPAPRVRGLGRDGPATPAGGHCAVDGQPAPVPVVFSVKFEKYFKKLYLSPKIKIFFSCPDGREHVKKKKENKINNH